MKLAPVTIAVAILIVAGLATHAEAKAAPLKILGGRKALADFGAVNPAHLDSAPFVGPIKSQPRHFLEPRHWRNPPDQTKKRCGPGVGSCDPAYCCSIGGYCGKGYHYCSGPACQLSYGDACDGNQRPLGEATLDVPRPLHGNASYEGAGIYTCKDDNHIALTFDDGPFNFTWHLLDVLASYNAKATFFITGNNMGKGQMDIEETGYPAILKRMHADGHQIAAHTWTHQNLTTLSETQLVNQMHYNEMAFRNVLGFFPTYMRPPYSECNETCQAIMKKLGYHITYYSVVTEDYLYDDPNLIWKSKQIWDEALAQEWVNTTNVNFITISHDIHYQSAYNLTNYMLDSMKWLKYGTSVTVGECLGDPKENWYRKASGAPPANLLMKKQTNAAIASRRKGAAGTIYALGSLWGLALFL